MEYTLLKSCFSFPKIAFALRTTDTSNHLLFLDRFDKAVRDALEGILGSPLTPSQWQQASLPSALGGLGLRSARCHAAAAYLGSLTAAGLLVQDIQQAGQAQGVQLPSSAQPENRALLPAPHSSLHLASLRSHTGGDIDEEGGEDIVGSQQPDVNPDPLQPPASVAQSLTEHNAQLGDPLTYGEVAALTRRSLSAKIDAESARQLLLSQEEEREQARLRCLARAGAGDWLSAFPSKSLGLHLRRMEFVTAARYRLGLPVFQVEADCPMPRCVRRSDRLGDHAISCGIGGERIARHNHVRDALFQTAVTAGLGPVREPDGLLPDSDDRPADLLIPFWSGGRDVALDFTVVNPLRADLVSKASEDASSAVQHAHELKSKKYEERCAAEGFTFLPMAVDTFGGWHPTALDIIIKLGRQLARNVGKLDEEVVAHLRQRLGILLVRDNVAMLCARTPTFPAAAVDGEEDS